MVSSVRFQSLFDDVSPPPPLSEAYKIRMIEYKTSVCIFGICFFRKDSMKVNMDKIRQHEGAKHVLMTFEF